MPTMTQRIRSGWNAFIGRDPTNEFRYEPEDQLGYGYGTRPDRARFTRGNQRSIVAAIYNRIAVDVASIHFEHARLDDNGRFKEGVTSGLNNCINVSANLDQTGKAFIRDMVESTAGKAHCPENQQRGQQNGRNHQNQSFQNIVNHVLRSFFHSRWNY